MANLVTLERRLAAIGLAEQRAVAGLADHLRQAVRDIPSESPLALMFVEHASTFDVWAGGRNPAEWTNATLQRLEQDLQSLLSAEDDWAEADAD
jgi:hypothetical protein